MALTLKKKSQNYIIDQGATFSKTIGAESSSSTAVTISSGTQTAALAEGKYFYSLSYTQSDSVTVERLAEGLITIEPSAEINNG
jgi:hypothetical protein